MPKTRIKICGITRVEDAVAAAHCGADAIGMVFHQPAPRCVSLERAREILAALPPFVTPVGLFVDAGPGEILETAATLGLRHVQLHGRESAQCVGALPNLVVLKAVRVSRDTFAAELDDWRRQIAAGELSNLRGLVLETPAAAPGGTGQPNDWAFVRQCQAQGLFRGLPPIIAAGGLTPANVAKVIRDIGPWAVDVSSGVEVSRGIKSLEKMREFAESVAATPQPR